MSVRRYAIYALVGASVIVPILIGASCPPPQTPGIFGLVTDSTNLTVLPACTSGYICITFTNSTSIPVNVALYRNNGFDTNNQCGSTSSFQCCTNPNSTVACQCPCAGAATGNCKLNRQQIFGGCTLQPPTANLSPINGAQTATLAVAQSLQEKVRCGDAKTLGAAVSKAADNPVTAPVDQNGPVYRDEAGGVTCGGTVQFLVVDLNQTTAGGTAGQDLVTLSIQTQFSQ